MKKYVLIIIAVIGICFLQAVLISHEPANKEELGKLLFFDPLLSKDSTISCASCHKPEYAFADSSATSAGVRGLKGTRNTPSAMNLALQSIFFWDGRAKSLEDQALKPIENPVEMNLPLDQAMMRLQRSKNYAAYFRKIFSSEPNRKNVAEALAAFERSLETSESPFDIWKVDDDSTAVSDAARRGFDIFNTKGKCIQCHFGSNFTLNEFRNVGLFNGKNLNDSGRATISDSASDLGKFKIAPLRNVAITGPYMHNGMFKTLREVIEFYNDPSKIVPDAINRDSLLAKPFGLTEQEKSDLEAFLESLTDKKLLVNKGH